MENYYSANEEENCYDSSEVNEYSDSDSNQLSVSYCENAVDYTAEV